MEAETLTTYRILFEDHDPRYYKDARAVILALKRFSDRARAGLHTPKPIHVVKTEWRLTRRRQIGPDDFAAHNAELKRLAAIEKKKAKIAELAAELEALQTEDGAIVEGRHPDCPRCGGKLVVDRIANTAAYAHADDCPDKPPRGPAIINTGHCA